MNTHSNQEQNDTQASNLEALKQAYTEAKAVRREAAKAVLEAKRVANAARWSATEAFGAYYAARPHKARRKSRPARTVDPDADLPFPEGAPSTEGEVA